MARPLSRFPVSKEGVEPSLLHFFVERDVVTSNAAVFWALSPKGRIRARRPA